MTGILRRAARSCRYAIPSLAGRFMPIPDARWAARRAKRLHEQGLRASLGYFAPDKASRHGIVDAQTSLCTLLGKAAAPARLSIKSPTLDHDKATLSQIIEAATGAGMEVMFDAISLPHAQPIHDLHGHFLPDHPNTGIVLPARWHRSLSDAKRLRDGSAPIRLVKGEWSDPDWPDCDIEANYLALVAELEGRAAPVSIATHDPLLARSALNMLVSKGTPCELEQLRGLPANRTTAVAHKMGVPVRCYIPYGPGWWPYAVDKALARPYLPIWWAQDLLGLK